MIHCYPRDEVVQCWVGRRTAHQTVSLAKVPLVLLQLTDLHAQLVYCLAKALHFIFQFSLLSLELVKLEMVAFAEQVVKLLLDLGFLRAHDAHLRVLIVQLDFHARQLHLIRTIGPGTVVTGRYLHLLIVGLVAGGTSGPPGLALADERIHAVRMSQVWRPTHVLVKHHRLIHSVVARTGRKR